MKCQYLQDKFKLVDNNLNKAKKASVNDMQLASMLSSYLVVLISGIYEDCVEHLIVQRAAKSNDKELENLIKMLIDRQFRNPLYKKIKEIINALDPSYKSKLDSKIDTRSREAINSIVRNKNNVAHGKTSNATLNDIADYHKRALKIFDALENILL